MMIMNEKLFEKIVSPYIFERQHLFNYKAILTHGELHQGSYVLEENKLIFIPKSNLELEKVIELVGTGHVDDWNYGGYIIYATGEDIYCFQPQYLSQHERLNSWAYKPTQLLGFSSGHLWIRRRGSLSDMNEGLGWASNKTYYVLDIQQGKNEFMNWRINPLEVE